MYLKKEIDGQTELSIVARGGKRRPQQSIMKSCTHAAMMQQSGTVRIAGTTTVSLKMPRPAGCGPLPANRVNTLMFYTNRVVRGQ